MPLKRNRLPLVVLLAFLCVLVVFPRSATAFGRRGTTLLVFPSRYVIVQLAFDLADLRDVILLAYQGDADSEQTTLHIWHGSKWVPLSSDSYAERRFLRRDPSKTVIVGQSEKLPPLLMAASGWCEDVARIEQTDIAGLIRNVARELRLRKRDVRWLAERYGLTLQEAQAGMAAPAPAAVYDGGDAPVATTLSSRWDMPRPLAEPAAPIP